MNAYMIAQYEDNGTVTALAEEYATWDLACIAQEAFETANPDKGYLIHTLDEWVYECENRI